MAASNEKRNWLVTGASRGMGRHLCELILGRGDRVVATAREPSVLQPLVDAHPDRIRAVAMDVTDATSVQKAVGETEKVWPIDVLVNNAGYVTIGAVEEVSIDQMQRAFDTNYFGMARVIQAVLPGMRARRRGHIVNVSSMSGVFASGGLGTYAATKHAVEAMTEALAAEVAPFGIKVTSIQPGSHRTEIQSQSQVGHLMPEYEASSGVIYKRFSAMNGSQPGDPRKAMETLLAIVDSPSPPLRLPIGADAVQRIRHKVQTLHDELERLQSLSGSS